MPILQWLGREKHVGAAEAVPYCVLEPDAQFGDASNKNLMIQGDNLIALKSLLPYYAGKIKCIYIDIPYNTKFAFKEYDDNLEHSVWMGTIYPRLLMLRELLSVDGTIWISIDDHEGHYLKVICDEVFGRKNFIANIVWQKRYSRENREAIGDAHEHILVYGDPDNFKKNRNFLPVGEKQKALYKNPDNDPRGDWQSVSLLAQGYRPNQMYEIVSPSGKIHMPPPGNCWKIIRTEYEKLLKENRVYFGKNGDGVPRRKEFLSSSKGIVPWTWWPHEECGHTDEAKKECNVLFGADVSFDTPKPERLIHRILEIATNPGDLVLDSFLGSGTTAAVAHKMGRQYIGIEMGEHAVTHCVPRLQKVIAGEQGGISAAVGWQGGGGFRFYRLGAPIFDAEGRINPDIRFPLLAAHVWFAETRTPLTGTATQPLLGIHEGTAFYLLYNGILGDKRPDGGNVLTAKVLAALPAHDGPKVIYGEACRLSPARLQDLGIVFKQTPYDLKAR